MDFSSARIDSLKKISHIQADQYYYNKDRVAICDYLIANDIHNIPKN